MKFINGLLALAAVAAAAPGAVSSLNIHLEKAGNSEIKATITNNGNKNLKLFKTGTILDERITEAEKAVVLLDGMISSVTDHFESWFTHTQSLDEAVKFEGVRLQITTDALTEDSFTKIPSGKSIEVTFDVAMAYDLSTTGQYGIQATGVFSFAEESSTELVGSIPYESNKLDLSIDGEVAAAARTAFLAKRTHIQSDCQGGKFSSVDAARARCYYVSVKAQRAAASGSGAKLREYFKSDSQHVRNTVAGVFGRVAAECRSNRGGNSRTHCADIRNYCSGNIAAYTLPGPDFMVYCEHYFRALPQMTKTCRAADRGIVFIHEATHLRSIKGTEDFGGYGYNFIRSLNGAQNLNHADTYSLYAAAIDSGC